jgi:hypothetical protein
MKKSIKQGVQRRRSPSRQGRRGRVAAGLATARGSGCPRKYPGAEQAKPLRKPIRKPACGSTARIPGDPPFFR